MSRHPLHDLISAETETLASAYSGKPPSGLVPVVRAMHWARTLAPELSPAGRHPADGVDWPDQTSDERASTSMANLVEDNSAWSLSYLAVLLYEAGHGLPLDDPWCRMAATIDFVEVAGGNSPHLSAYLSADTASTPLLTGAVHPSGMPFGGAEDWRDLDANVLQRVLDSQHADPTSALSPLPRLSAALLAAAGHNASTVRRVVAATHGGLSAACRHGHLEGTAGEAVLSAVEPALRWLLLRRLAQFGEPDDFWAEATANANTVAAAWVSGARPGSLHFISPRWRRVTADRRTHDPRATLDGDHS